MSEYQKIFDEFNAFLMSIRDINSSKILEYGISFNLKNLSLQEMYLGTLKNAERLEEAQKKESAEAKIAIQSGIGNFPQTETSKAYVKSVAYFEAYLNTLYSLLQVLTKITLIIYQNSKKQIDTNSMGDNIGKLLDYLKNQNRDADSAFTSYIDQKMGWYQTFRNNRHKITHDGSALLFFTENGEIEFLDYPKNGAGFGNSNINKQGLENYVKNRVNDVFDFLDFYVKHFREWTD